MELGRYSRKRIKEICTWERAQQDRIYQAGCFAIQVSATSGQMMYIGSCQKVESKYCVFTVTDNQYDPEYVYLMVQQALPEFLHKNQTGMNIQTDAFGRLELILHDDRMTQMYVVEVMRLLDERQEEEAKTVRVLKDFKKYHLAKMFPEGMRGGSR